MPINRTTLKRDLEEGLNAHFGAAYRQLPREYLQCFDMEQSGKAVEEDVLETGFGAAAVKPEGAAVTYDEPQQGWLARYEHETTALAFQFTEEAREDNLYFQIGPKYARQLARSLNHTTEIRGANIYNRAVTAGYTGGDGVTLLSAAHPLLGGGTASNTLGTPADFSEDALETILIAIRKTKDDRGLPIALAPTDILLPPEVQYDAARILRSKLRSGTAENDLNAVKYFNVFDKDPIVVTRFTDADQWFVRTDCPDGLKYFERVGLKRAMAGDFETGNLRYKVRRRDSFGWSNWRGVFGSEGAA